MPAKTARRTAPVLVTAEAAPPAALPAATPGGWGPSYISRPLVYETLGGSIEWGLTDPARPDCATIRADVQRGTGDAMEDVVSQTVPSFRVELAVAVGGPVGKAVDVTFPAFEVPMHGGLKALAQLFLELHARAEQLNLASLGWDSDDDERVGTLQRAEA